MEKLLFDFALQNLLYFYKRSGKWEEVLQKEIKKKILRKYLPRGMHIHYRKNSSFEGNGSQRLVYRKERLGGMESNRNWIKGTSRSSQVSNSCVKRKLLLRFKRKFFCFCLLLIIKLTKK